MNKLLTKKQLLNFIDELQRKPSDRVRIFGDLGITALGGSLGVAAAGSAAAIAGATAVPALTTAASWLGLTLVATTPIGWLVGGAAAGGALAFGVSRLIHNGGISEGRRAELLLVYQQQLNDLQRKAVRTQEAKSTTVEDRNRFISALREIVEKNAITPTRALDLIEKVESGAISLSDAYQAVMAVVREGKH